MADVFTTNPLAKARYDRTIIETRILKLERQLKKAEQQLIDAEERVAELEAAL